jgi:ankyrin repeat protein
MLPRVSIVFLVLVLCFGAGAQTVPEAEMRAAIAAIKAGKIKELERLLKLRRELVLASDNKYRATLLHWAADEKDLEAVSLLIKHNASLAAKNNEGATPLQLAIVPNPDKPSGTDLLALVKKLSDTEVVKIRNIDGKTALHLACQYGQLEVAKYLIEKMKADVNAPTRTGKEPLYYARASKNDELIKLLEAKKAKPGPPEKAELSPTPTTTPAPTPTPTTNEDSPLALQIAAGTGKLDAVRRILRKNHKWINSQNDHKETPLHLAAKNHHLDVIAELIKQGADVELKDENHKTFWALLCPPPVK